MALGIDRVKKVLIVAGLIIGCILAVWIVWSLGLDETTETILTVLILLTLPVALLVSFFARRRARMAAVEPAIATQPATTEPEKPRGAYTELNATADEAVQWLRDNLRNAKDGDAIYSLPWFLVGGPHLSGKSSLLVSANLDFQTLPSQLRADESVVRPTRNCDWRISNSAVWIDTAGRYQSEGPDRDEWLALIETLKRVRKQRPLDGLILVVSLARLLTAGDQECETQARILRDRLDDLIIRTGSAFPIYLVFTHADAIEGFDEFFRSINPAQRGQVWGATFDLDRHQNAHAQFAGECKAMHDFLMRRRLYSLSGGTKPIEHLRIFGFPEKFRLACRKLNNFVELICRSNPHLQRESPRLRGFYFVSNFVASRPDTRLDARSAATTEMRATGSGAFVHDLFNRVIAADRSVAAALQSFRQKPRPWREALAAAAGLALLALSISVVISYFGNKSLIEEAAKRGKAMEELARANSAKDASSRTPADVAEEFRRLEALRQQLVELDEYDQSRPLALSFGLYSGNSIKPYLRTIYFEQVYQRFLKPTVAALGQELISFDPSSASEQPSENEAVSDRDKALGEHYDRLKAYLMMSNLKPPTVKIDSALLSQQLTDRVTSSTQLTDEQLSQAKDHLNYFAAHAAAEDAPHFRFSETNAEVEKSRNNLANSYQLVVYKGAISRLQNFDSVTYEKIVKDERKDWLAGAYTVPGSYTIEAYRAYLDNLDQITDAAKGEEWVLGNKAVKVSGGINKDELKARYQNDYIKQWRNFLHGLQAQGMNRDNESKVLEEMSDTGSPMEKVLREAARQTNVSAAPSSRFMRWLKGLFSDKTGYVVKGDRIENEFGALFDFLKPGKETPLLKYQQALRDLSAQMAGPAPDGDPRKDQRIANAEKALAAPLGVFRTASGYKTIAAQYSSDLLKQPIKRMVEARSGEVRSQLISEWNSLAPTALKFENSFRAGFPFNTPNGPAVQEFQLFFNPVDGRLKKFFDNQTILPDSLVNYLNQAERLRNALYPQGSQTAAVQLQVTIVGWSDASAYAEIKIDNCPPANTQGTGSSACTWPATGGEVGAQIRILGAADQRVLDESKFPTEWGVFQMFARGNPRLNTDGGYDLAWPVGRQTVRAKLKPSRTPHPFQREIFSNWQTPQNLR